MWRKVEFWEMNRPCRFIFPITMGKWTSTPCANRRHAKQCGDNLLHFKFLKSADKKRICNPKNNKGIKQGINPCAPSASHCRQSPWKWHQKITKCLHIALHVFGHHMERRFEVFHFPIVIEKMNWQGRFISQNSTFLHIFTCHFAVFQSILKF